MTSTYKIRDYPAYPFHGVNFSKITLTTLLPERKDRFGGPGRNPKLIQIISIYTNLLLSAVFDCITVT